MHHVWWYLRWQNVVIFQHVQKRVSCLSSKDIIFRGQTSCVPSPQSFPFSLYIWQNYLLKELQGLPLVNVVLQISTQRIFFWIFSFVYQLHWEKFIFHDDRKSGSDGSFIIYSRDRNVFLLLSFPLYLKKSRRILKVSGQCWELALMVSGTSPCSWQFGGEISIRLFLVLLLALALLQ